MSNIKHIVMWDVAGNSDQERNDNVLKIKSAFEALVGVIPGLLTMEIGVNVSGADYACDVVLYSEFESVESLRNYAVHPAHTQARTELGNIRIARHEVDYLS